MSQSVTEVKLTNAGVIFSVCVEFVNRECFISNEALSKLLREPVYCIGCGRTDAGVHAKQFYLHFDTSQEITDNFVFKLNRFLGFDFAIFQLIKVHENAHSRFDAFSRTYEYHMHFNENPFNTRLSGFVYPKPDLQKMVDAAPIVMDYSDFKPLCKTHESKTNICHIYRSDIRVAEDGYSLIYTISANRFLRNMVRMTTGCLIMIGQGKMEPDYFREVMGEVGVFKYIMPVPACGLYLTSVKYPYL